MKRKKRRSSIFSMICGIMIPIGIVVIVLFLAAFNNLQKAQEMAHTYMMNTARLFVKDIKMNVNKISSEVYERCEEDYYYRTWPEEVTPRTVDRKIINEIVTDNSFLKGRYGQEYKFFMYGSEADILVYDSNVCYKDGFETALAKELRGVLADLGNHEWKWDVFYVKEIPYLVCAYAQKATVSGCYMDIKEILEDLKMDNMGYRIEPYALWENEELITIGSYIDKEKLESTEKRQGLLNERNCSYSVCGGMEIGALLIADDGILKDVIDMQIFLMSIIAVLGGIVVFGGCYLYLRLLKPMRQFVVNLRTPEVELFLDNTGDLDVVELEVVSKEFKELLSRIKRLKIAIYERDLLSQRVQMEFAQEQMQAHFYLNCLSVLCGMAERNNDGQMTVFLKVLSRYMGYVNNDSYEMKTIREELGHIRDYIEIQHIRYKNAFVFEMDVEENLLDCFVPTLVLQTFVENSVKHEVGLRKQLIISLYITTERWEEEDYLYISISDTGEGFSEEILESISEDRPIYYDNRKHMGISNTKQRLKLIYGNKWSMKLSNMPNGNGAVVELTLPLLKEGRKINESIDRG